MLFLRKCNHHNIKDYILNIMEIIFSSRNYFDNDMPFNFGIRALDLEDSNKIKNILEQELEEIKITNVEINKEDRNIKINFIISNQEDCAYFYRRII